MSLKERIQTGLSERKAERKQRQREAAEKFAKIHAQHEAEALKAHWQKVGEQLGDFNGRMILVTNFGGRDTLTLEQGRQIAEIVEGKLGFGTDTSVTMSVHAGKAILESRGGWDEYMESAISIRDSLESLGYAKMSPERNALIGTGYETPRGSAAETFRAAAQTAIEYKDLNPENNLHILVTSALDTPEVGISYVNSAGGKAFLLENAPTDGSAPEWQDLMPRDVAWLKND